MDKVQELSGDTNCFIVRSGLRDVRSWLNDQTVAIGWSKAEGLNRETNWSRFKDIIRNAYEKEWPMTERALGNMAGSAYQFIHNIRPGDLALVPQPASFYAARVRSEVFYDAQAIEIDSAWKRRVQWIRLDAYSRANASNPLQRRLKVQQTCVEMTDLKEDIRTALHRERPLRFNESVIARAADAVAGALLRDINDRQLEDLVEKLARSSGATTERPVKTTRLAGDVDIIAIYDLRIGNEESVVKVGYQVKQHEGTTDSWGVKQLIDRMEVDRSITRGCIVTTAPALDGTATMLAEHNGIIVVKQRELVEWILMSGLELLGEK